MHEQLKDAVNAVAWEWVEKGDYPMFRPKCIERTFAEFAIQVERIYRYQTNRSGIHQALGVWRKENPSDSKAIDIALNGEPVTKEETLEFDDHIELYNHLREKANQAEEQAESLVKRYKEFLAKEIERVKAA